MMCTVRPLGPDSSGRHRWTFCPERAEAKEKSSATAGIPSNVCGGQVHAPARVTPTGFSKLPPQSRLVRTFAGGSHV